MKCKEAEISILMQDSGELKAARTDALAVHLADCQACRDFKRVMLDSAEAFGSGFEPGPKAVQDVMRTARVCAPVRKQISFMSYRPILGMAASFLIILALLVGNIRPDQVGMELVVNDAQMLEPADQVVSIMYEGLSEDDLAFNFLMTYEGDSEG